MGLTSGAPNKPHHALGINLPGKRSFIQNIRNSGLYLLRDEIQHRFLGFAYLVVVLSNVAIELD